jgi:hypothetical protein
MEAMVACVLAAGGTIDKFIDGALGRSGNFRIA